MYKVFIIGKNEQIQECLDIINKEHATIRFIEDSSSRMYIFYEVPDYRSDI